MTKKTNKSNKNHQHFLSFNQIKHFSPDNWLLVSFRDVVFFLSCHENLWKNTDLQSSIPKHLNWTFWKDHGNYFSIWIKNCEKQSIMMSSIICNLCLIMVSPLVTLGSADILILTCSITHVILQTFWSVWIYCTCNVLQPFKSQFFTEKRISLQNKMIKGEEQVTITGELSTRS